MASGIMRSLSDYDRRRLRNMYPEDRAMELRMLVRKRAKERIIGVNPKEAIASNQSSQVQHVEQFLASKYGYKTFAEAQKEQRLDDADQVKRDESWEVTMKPLLIVGIVVVVGIAIAYCVISGVFTP